MNWLAAISLVVILVLLWFRRIDGKLIALLNENREAMREKLIRIYTGLPSRSVKVTLKCMFDPPVCEFGLLPVLSGIDGVHIGLPYKHSVKPWIKLTLQSRFRVECWTWSHTKLYIDPSAGMLPDTNVVEYDWDDENNEFFILVFEKGSGYDVYVTPSRVNYEKHQKEPLQK